MIVTIAEAIAAMPEEPSPPAVDFACSSVAGILSSINLTIFVFNIFVSSVAVSILNNEMDKSIGVILVIISTD